MLSRRELMSQASAGGVSLAELSRRYGVSRKTAYKWMERHQAEGETGLADRSRRPGHSPEKTSAVMTSQVVKLREQHPAWGARKLRARLQRLGVDGVPSSATVNRILRRQGMIEESASRQRQAWQRFEKALPNELWQMDFKGHFGMSDGQRCHPLTVLDDHSRYCMVLQACANERGATVQTALIGTFRRYGMPWSMLMDNGSPWGDAADNPWTWLTVWLVRLGISVSHGRPYHPQTQGKQERFHRSLNDEVLKRRCFGDLAACEQGFRKWRETYNHERPHEALSWSVPASRYQVSTRSYPEKLPKMEYLSGDDVRKVQQGGWITVRGRAWHIGKGFAGESVAVRRSGKEGIKQVWYAGQCVGQLREAEREARAMERSSRAGWGKAAPVASLPPPPSPTP